MLQSSGNEKKSTHYVQCFFLYCQPQNYSVLRHSISDMAPFGDELEQNLLHTDS